jgi:hypothetical protein
LFFWEKEKAKRFTWLMMGLSKSDVVRIGPAPCDEECAQVGQKDYRERAVEECMRFIKLLRKTFGDEPEGARLAIKWFDHDFGSYCEVVCWYEKEDAREYAFRCENETPLSGKAGGGSSLSFTQGRSAL